jgi:hypothetical protein
MLEAGTALDRCKRTLAVPTDETEIESASVMGIIFLVIIDEYGDLRMLTLIAPTHIQNFWPSLDLKEKKKSCQRKQARTSYEESTYLIRGIHLDRMHEGLLGYSPLRTFYVEGTGRCDLRVRHRKPGNART